MIKAYSQRLMPPYSGQVQIVESDRARALTLDADTWEIHFFYSGGIDAARKFHKATSIRHAAVSDIANGRTEAAEHVDERIVELAQYIESASFPFAAADRYEYWLLDKQDRQPLAQVFSCSRRDEMDAYPDHPEWTALPAAVLPIELTEEEASRSDAPVNYQLESIVRQRAGSIPKAVWVERQPGDEAGFPPLLLREDWDEDADRALCRRYLLRQSTRLLMLHGLSKEDRGRMEIAAKAYPFEVARFFPMYPEVVEEALMKAILIEARLRHAEAAEYNALHGRRDGVLYQ